MAGRHTAPGSFARSRRSPFATIAGVVGELLITAAVICALYIVWQLWWTGVQAEHTQAETRQEVSWTQPGGSGEDDGTTAIAAPQQGEPPVQPESADYGDLVAELYIPRFGSNWHRNVVEGTDAAQLARHGLGHYSDSAMPGALGNFAVAGHRSGYGEPLVDVDKLQEGDPIIVRTQDYWYVYTYTNYKITVPSDTDVVAPNPENPGANPVKRMITLTTCEPKYTYASKRWISWGTLKYWAKVSDGVPTELASRDTNGAVRFAINEQPSALAKLGSLKPVVFWALMAWAILAVAAAVAWRWPAIRDIRQGLRPRPDFSLYGWLTRLQPGVLPIRLLLMALLMLAASAALLEWVFPWAASTVPVLQEMSNYVPVG